MRGHIRKAFLCRKRVPPHNPLASRYAVIRIPNHADPHSPLFMSVKRRTGMRSSSFPVRAFIKGFPESGALGHEGVAEGYAAGDEQPARAKRGQRPVPAGPGVETGVPAQRPGFAPERFGGDFVSLPAFSGEKQMEQAKPAP